MPPPELFVFVALAAGLGFPYGVAASLATALPVALLEEGRTPADATVAAIRGVPLTRVRALDAWLVHLGAGAALGPLAGIVFVVAVLFVGAAPAHAALAVGALVVGIGLLHLTFLVRPTRGVSSVRMRAVRRAWLPTALLFAAVLAGGLYTFLGTTAALP